MKYLKDELLQRDELGYCDVYTAFLFYREKPDLNRELLYKNMEKYAGDGGEAGDGRKENLMVFESHGSDEPIILFHLNHMIVCEDGQVPSQTCIAPDEDMPQIPNGIFEQARDLPEAKERFSECRYCVSQTLMMCGGMDYKERLQLFRSALRATLETAGCDIIYWEPAMKLVDPARFLDTFADDPLCGAFNIRLYNMADSGEKQALVMDTCGLSVLGLPDLQCHYYDLNPNELAERLHDLAYYLFEAGDVIRDGNTVFEEHWKCLHEYSIIPPKRHVLNLDPGTPFYAG